jgi:predicted MFS family arabinose efflux permease
MTAAQDGPALRNGGVSAWRLAFGGMLAMAAAIGIGRFVYTPILPEMIADLGLSRGEAGLIASGNFFGYLLGAIATTLPGLPGSRRSWLVAGLAGNALALAATAWVDSLPALIAARALGGVASAFILVFAAAIVLDALSAAGRGALAALLFSGIGVGVIVSATAVSLLIAARVPWQGLWLAAAVLATLALAAVPRLVPAAADRGRSDPPDANAGPLRRVWALILAYGLFGFGYIITATFIVDIVRGTAVLVPLEPYVWVCFGLGAAPSVLLWNAIARRLGAVGAYAVASLVQAFGIAASVLWISPAGIIAAAVLLGGTVVGLTALGLVAARGLSRGDPRSVLAWMTVAFGAGQMVGPSVGGFARDLSGSYTGASLVATAALLAGSALAFHLRRQTGQRAA